MNQNWFCSCPECDAVLRLTAEQLNQYQGLVGCGACEKTFMALDHMMIKTASGFAPWESSQVLDENDHENGSIAHPAPLEITESFEKIPSEPPGTNDNESEDPDHGEHPTDPRNLFSDNDGDTAQSEEIRSPFTENEGLSDHRAEDETGIRESSPGSRGPGSGEGSRLFHENDYVSEFDRARYESFTESSDTRGQSGDRSGGNGDGSLGLNESGEDPFSKNPAFAETSIGIDRSEVDQYIVDYPNPLVTFTWLLVVAGFVFLLGLQVKYFFVEKYAQDESYRQYLEVFCKVAACELPPQKNLYGFTLTHTKIDLHPTQPGAMRLTVKLVNEAEFEQPYPALQLTFTDRGGRVVGRRTFGPDLYLTKESENRIGRGEYVTILFDLARPHEKAVGFVVDIVTEPVS